MPTNFHRGVAQEEERWSPKPKVATSSVVAPATNTEDAEVGSSNSLENYGD